MKRLQDFFRAFDLESTGKWFLLSALIGVVAGMGAILFQFLSQSILHGFLARYAGYAPAEPIGEHVFFKAGDTVFCPWMIVLVMAGGGLLSGWLVYRFAPEAEGHGTDAAIDAFHNRRGEIRARIPWIKTLASAITLGTGGSAGREGPIAQIGAGFGSLLASRLKLSTRDRRIMLAAGMGAGIGAIFRAPIAGALFAGEILYRDVDLESDVIVPSAVSSTIAYSVYCLSLPSEIRFTPLFGKNLQFSLGSPLELIPFAFLAVAMALAGILYVKVFYGTRSLFDRMPIQSHFRPAIGAALAGMLGLGLYYALNKNLDVLAVLGSGYGILQKVFSSPESMTVNVLLTVALFKIFTTSLTISSGGSGGVFGPSIVIGGCFGAAIGKLFHDWWPHVVLDSQPFAIVGMAGFFAGVARAPFSTILMVSEMTGDYKLLLPTMWVATICFLLNRRWSIYQKQVPTRLDSPAHRGDFIVDVLEGILVEDVYQRGRKITMVPEGASLNSIVHLLAKTTQRYFPVIDEKGLMVGIFSAEDVRSYLFDDTIWSVANAGDVMAANIVSVKPTDDLNTALRRFTALNVDELPVVDPKEPRRLIGMVRRKESIAAYNRRLMEHKRAMESSDIID
ncbi:MAG: chloride channel protein [Pirellulales bacterium]|nr:chloride channel protein [Pirellulales bacterium]